jgi:hypothetical protein
MPAEAKREAIEYLEWYLTAYLDTQPIGALHLTVVDAGWFTDRRNEPERAAFIAVHTAMAKVGQAARELLPPTEGQLALAARGYELIDFARPKGLDRDRELRFMEYVRANLSHIVSGVPAGCEVDLFAGGHPHNVGLVPLLGLWAPAALRDRVPNPFRMLEEVSAWCSGLSAAEVDRIVAATEAPTWKELVRIRVHPSRRHDDAEPGG